MKTKREAWKKPEAGRKGACYRESNKVRIPADFSSEARKANREREIFKALREKNPLA